MKPSIKLRPRPRHWFLAASFLILPALAPAADFHVATDGDDKQPGTQAAPFRTLAAAGEAARKFAGRENVTIHVVDSTHSLPETPMLTAADSGSEEHPAACQDLTGAKAVLGGGQLFTSTLRMKRAM